MPDYIHKTPHNQSRDNNEVNKAYDQIVRLGMQKINRIFHVDNETVIKCAYAFVPVLCRVNFPSCDGTKSEYKKKKICSETCHDLIRICGWKAWNFVVRIITNNRPDPETKKLLHCQLMSYRNAGDSPECWYSDFESSAGNKMERG